MLKNILAGKKSLQKPNIVLICVDQWRGDCLEVSGHPVLKTPHLNQVALGGVNFSSAFSACPSCIAARASLLTGMSPVKCGRVGYKDGVPWNYRDTLPSILAENGYHCQGIGKMHTCPERSKLGFHDVILHDGYIHFARRHAERLEDIDDYIAFLRMETGREDADYFEHGLGCNSFLARPWDKAEYLHPTNYVTAHSVEYLRGRRGNQQPFFLFCSYVRPHPPYDPPQWAFDMYMQSEMPPVPVGIWSEFLGRYANGKSDSPVASLGVQELRRAISGYYGHMTHIDHQINRILEAIVECGIEQETVFVCVSDHGELMGDHHLFRKSLPYEGSARIPLLLAGRGIPKNIKISAVVSLQDIMPTILDCAGIGVPVHVDGRSLMTLLCGESGSVRDLLYGEHTYGGQSVHFVTDGEWKYIWWSGDGREQLFNRKDDPHELRERSKDEPERLLSMRKALIGELSGREEGYSDGTRLITGCQPRDVLPWAETGHLPDRTRRCSKRGVAQTFLSVTKNKI